ncbi:unnamed protein product [Brugia timori]|uniref:Uncharacterized protein n=1 Tax=Brugia timori TaxID=42155 RepID=A0A0R3Q4Y4_9BILA|nr:unnamed protein product [Brugia timori]
MYPLTDLVENQFYMNLNMNFLTCVLELADDELAQKLSLRRNISFRILGDTARGGVPAAGIFGMSNDGTN